MCTGRGEARPPLPVQPAGSATESHFFRQKITWRDVAKLETFVEGSGTCKKVTASGVSRR